MLSIAEGAFMKMVHGVTKDRVKSGAAVYSKSHSFWRFAAKLSTPSTKLQPLHSDEVKREKTYPCISQVRAHPMTPWEMQCKVSSKSASLTKSRELQPTTKGPLSYKVFNFFQKKLLTFHGKSFFLLLLKHGLRLGICGLLTDDEATKDRLNMLLEVLESCVAIPSPCRFAGSG